MEKPKENKEERETFTITPSDEVFKKGDTIQIKIEKVYPQTPDSMDWEDKIKPICQGFDEWCKEHGYSQSESETWLAVKSLIQKQLALAHSSGRRKGIEEATEVFKKHYTFVGDLDTECEKELKSLLE